MPEQKLLPKPAVALAYGEPWRANGGALVCDQHRQTSLASRSVGERAYYGGTLIAESITRQMATRAADCVNFCAGVEFKPGHAYVGGLADLLDALELLHRESPEPNIPVETRAEHEYFRQYADIDQLLRQFGRDARRRKVGL